MAWFSYQCGNDGVFRKSLPKREKKHICPVCGILCPVILKQASSQVVEILDNGAMVRSVERLANIEEIMEKRADNHSQKKHLD